MSKNAEEDRDLDLVQQLLFTNCGAVAQRYSKKDMLSGRTPDFKLMAGGKIVAFCEVKSPHNDWYEKELPAALVGAEAFQIVGGVQRDTTASRIARQVEKAASQFDAVNADHSIPNILAFVSNSSTIRVEDFWEAVTGEFDGIPTAKRISEGKLAIARARVDLFVWIDLSTRKIQQYIFSKGQPGRVTALCSLLGLDESKNR